jgi:hypothetical protein
MVGHVHLTMNVYEDIYEILASFGMNIIVAIGFWISWKDYKKEINSLHSFQINYIENKK